MSSLIYRDKEARWNGHNCNADWIRKIDASDKFLFLQNNITVILSIIPNSEIVIDIHQHILVLARQGYYANQMAMEDIQIYKYTNTHTHTQAYITLDYIILYVLRIVLYIIIYIYIRRSNLSSYKPGAKYWRLGYFQKIRRHFIIILLLIYHIFLLIIP